jgi:hypothetical protein
VLLPTDLLGEWVLRRRVDDRRAGVDGIVTGTTCLTRTGPDEVRWDESGTMTLDGRTVPVSRTLFVRRSDVGVDDAQWTVFFADGRPFHDWVWGERVDHACAPDDYTGVLAGDADRWTVRWEAHGPAKDYVLDSELRRRSHPAD